MKCTAMQFVGLCYSLVSCSSAVPTRMPSQESIAISDRCLAQIAEKDGLKPVSDSQLNCVLSSVQYQGALPKLCDTATGNLTLQFVRYKEGQEAYAKALDDLQKLPPNASQAEINQKNDAVYRAQQNWQLKPWYTSISGALNTVESFFATCSNK